MFWRSVAIDSTLAPALAVTGSLVRRPRTTMSSSASAKFRDGMYDAPGRMKDRIATAVDGFTGMAPQKDDQTLVIARIA